MNASPSPPPSEHQPPSNAEVAATLTEVARHVLPTPHRYQLTLFPTVEPPPRGRRRE